MNERNLIKLLIEMFGTTSPANTQSTGDKLVLFRPDAGVDSYVNIVELSSFATQLGVIINTAAVTMLRTLDVTGAITSAQVSANTAEDLDSDTDDVLTTTIANTEYGMLMVRETSGTEGCLFLITGGAIEKIGADATFNVAKDNASTYNVYFETNVIKIQNKVGDNKVIRAGLFSI